MRTPPSLVKIHPSPSCRADILCNKDSSYVEDTTSQVVRCFWQAVLLGNRDANYSHGACTLASQQLKKCGAFCSIQSLWINPIQSLWINPMPDTQTRDPWQTPVVTGVTLSISITESFFIKTDYKIILHFNICDFATSKKPEFPVFLYYFNNFLSFIISGTCARSCLGSRKFCLASLSPHSLT